jgi:hypothetical protein
VEPVRCADRLIDLAGQEVQPHFKAGIIGPEAVSLEFSERGAHAFAH